MNPLPLYLPPIGEPVAVYFSNTGAVQYLTFSNNTVNISNETTEVNYMINESADLPSDGAITFVAAANSSSGSIVGHTEMTLLITTIT